MKLQNIKQQLKGLNKYAYVCFGSVCVNYGDGWDSIGGVVDKVNLILNFLVSFSVVVGVAVLIYGAYQFILAGGDEGKIDQGQKMITGAIIGLVIVFVANLVIRYVITDVLK